MLEDALRYPFRGEDSTERLIIGGGLPFLAAAIYLVGFVLLFAFVGIFVMPFAIVPRVLLWGYVVSVVAAVLAGSEEPPGFDNWKRFGFDGLKAVVVSLGYSIPLILLVVLFLAVGAMTGAFAEESASAGALFGGVFSAVIGLLIAAYSLALYYVLPAAVVNFVREDDLTAAFDLSTLKAATLDSEYLVAWLLAAVVLTVGSVVAFPLYFLLVGFVLRFYVLVVAAYLVTRGTMDALDWDAPTGERAAEFAASDGRADAGAGDEWSDLSPAVRRVDGGE